MNARRLLWALTLAIPLLLAWIVVAGEINRHADRSAGVHVLVKADRVDETAFSAPRLTMHDPLLESRPVESGFHAGQDVFLRYDNKEGQWVFDKARPKTGEPVWSAAAIDVPARVVIERAGALTAEPLLPDEFAISRATMARLKRETMLDLTLHKGALGTVWVSDAFESALPLGKVVAILPPREGESPVLVVDVPASVAGWSYVPGKSTGWIAQIDEGQIGISKDFDGQPLDAVALPQGIAVAMRPSSRSLAMAGESAERFAIRFGDRVASYQGEFHVFDDDGSFWSVQSLPFPSGLQKRLIKRSIEGVVRNEIAVDGQIGGAASDTFLINDGYEVHRYAIDGSKAVLKDSWT
ncbi:MAG TPA: hypothetical protein VEZ11_15335, partial [Thermoanaerobaculia bacterium]|nr:hypothetical protein [Thermoanaerobaculia bacterium]